MGFSCLPSPSLRSSQFLLIGLSQGEIRRIIHARAALTFSVSVVSAPTELIQKTNCPTGILRGYLRLPLIISRIASASSSPISVCPGMGRASINRRMTSPFEHSSSWLHASSFSFCFSVSRTGS
jgi:hypothetical protein